MPRFLLLGISAATLAAWSVIGQAAGGEALSPAQEAPSSNQSLPEASHPSGAGGRNCSRRAEPAAPRSGRGAVGPLPGPPARVFSPGDAGVACFRIPAAVRAASGVLLAFAEARRGGCDDGAAEEIALSRSLDGGKTWSNASIAAGGQGHPVGNPYPIALSSGRVVLVYLKRKEKSPDLGSGNGVVFSDDAGLTWSAERDVSEGFGPARGSLPGPGAGVELSGSKRLLVVSHHGGYQRDYVTLSDDGGQTWQTANQSFRGMDEGTLADLGGGAVLLNMRHLDEAKTGRAVARSYDGGMTWSNVTFDEALLGPVCEGSLAAFGGSVFFSNPATPRGRFNLTVRRSEDGGQTWSRGLLIQGNVSSGYSSLVPAPVAPGRGGVLFEAAALGALDFRDFPLAAADPEWSSDFAGKPRPVTSVAVVV